MSFADSYTFRYKKKGGSWQTVKGLSKTSYIIKGLDLGTICYFKVRAENTLGSSDYCAKKKQTALPPKPEITKTASVDSGIRIYWSPASYASGYRLYRATSKNGTYSCIKEIKGNTKKSYTDTSAKKNKTYYYKLVCFITKNKVKYKSSASVAVKQKKM